MGLMVQRENHHTLRNRYSMGIPVQRPYHIDTMQTPLELQRVLQEREKLYFPMAQDISVLQRPLVIADRTIPNSIAVQPCEAFDAELDGNPSERTVNRYKEFAAGGSGMIWFEGYAIGCDGKDSPHQLML